MTAAEAIAEIEGRFIVHDEVGRLVVSYDDNGKEYETGARNWSVAPCGERYVTVTSGGVKSQHEPIDVMFSSESRAFRWWTYAVMDYAETVAPEVDWPNLHLYWRQKPSFDAQEFIALNQADVLQRGEPLLPMKLGTVYSRLLITRLRPDGTEGP